MISQGKSSRSLLTLAVAASVLAACSGTTPSRVRAPALAAASSTASAAPVVPASIGSPPPGAVATPPGLAVTPAPTASLAPATLAGLAGIVRAPATLVSDHGGAVISNNSAGIISNNSGSLVSDHGNARMLLALAEQVPVAKARVEVVDAAGQPVLGKDGKALVTGTDASGHYAFPGVTPAANWIVRVPFADGSGALSGIAARATVTADLDLVSSLTTGYILARYVATQADPVKTLEKLPADVEADTRAKASAALAAAATKVGSLAPDRVVAAVDELRRSNAAFNDQMALVKKLLVAAGLSDLGEGQLATSVTLGFIHDLAQGLDGTIYIDCGDDKRIWRLRDGRLETAVGNGSYDPKGADQDGVEAIKAPLYGVAAMGVTSDGHLVFLDGNRLYRLEASGKLHRLATASGQAAALATGLAGEVWTCLENGEVAAIAPDGTSRLLGTFPVGAGRVTWMVRNAASGLLLAQVSHGGGTVFLSLDPATGKTGTFQEGSGQGFTLDTAGGGYERGPGSETVNRFTPGGAAAGTLPFIDALEQDPSAFLLLGDDGTLYWPKSDKVYALGPAGISLVAGQDLASGSQNGLSAPHGMLPQTNGDLLVSDGQDQIVRTLAGQTTVQPYATGLNLPGRLATDTAGEVFVLNGANEGESTASANIQQVKPDGTLVLRYTPPGPRPDETHPDIGRWLTDFGCAPDGTLTALEEDQDTGELVVTQVSPSGATHELGRRVWDTQAPGHESLAIARDGRVYTIGQGTLYRWDASTPTAVDHGTWATSDAPAAAVFDAKGRLLVLNGNDVVRYDLTTRAVTAVAGPRGPVLNGDGVDTSLHNPAYLAFDAAGNLYIGDPGHKQIKRLAAAALP